MTPRTFTEVALKILGLFSLIEGGAKIFQARSFRGFYDFFSIMGFLESEIPTSLVLLIFGWYFLQRSLKIANQIFNNGEPLSPLPESPFGEWHISLISVFGAFLCVWVIPIYLSRTTALVSILLRSSPSNQVFTSQSLWNHLMLFGGFTFFQVWISLFLLFKSQQLTGFIRKIQGPQFKEVQ